MKIEDDRENQKLEDFNQQDLDQDESVAKGGFGIIGYGEDNLKRKPGTGPYRILKPIQMRDDLYSMIFATCFHPEYVLHADIEAKKKDALLNEIIDDYKTEPNKRKTPKGVMVYKDDPVEEPKSAKDLNDDYLSELKVIRKRLRQDKDNYLSQLMAVWLFQVTFTFFIVFDAWPYPYEEEQWTLDDKINLQELPKVKIAYIRFVSGMIMHVQVNGEILNGLRMMKFSANHWWKFKFHRVAFLTGLM